MNKNKAIRFVDKIIKIAKKERDTKGYRENLGYDQANKVRDEIYKLGLEYNQEAEVMKYFYLMCDSI